VGITVFWAIIFFILVLTFVLFSGILSGKRTETPRGGMLRRSDQTTCLAPELITQGVFRPVQKRQTQLFFDGNCVFWSLSTVTLTKMKCSGVAEQV
jgi:hypothetical protein